MINVRGSHQALLNLLSNQFYNQDIIIDGKSWKRDKLNPNIEHSIHLKIAKLEKGTKLKIIHTIVKQIESLGSLGILINYDKEEILVPKFIVSLNCGLLFRKLEPKHFHQLCS
ncbi:MAG: hypothetical protein GF311_18460 [Candidatus Lokiarchaeota archaeon]|nr:hypothetical protein [Candidatus Lokiarchaeota archaeon]